MQKSFRGQTGFTYIGVLIVIAILGIGLLAVSEVWITTAQREKLAQLNWVGEQYVQAIESYYYSNTGSIHFYPQTLNDLIEDKRYLSVKRHIRTLYRNPFTQTNKWKLIPSSEGGIRGIEYHQLPPEFPVDKQFLFAPVTANAP